MFNVFGTARTATELNEAKILLVVVFIMTVFVDIGRATIETERFLVLHIVIPSCAR
ncbi:hypothetical protein [Fervidobacterium changbaicum]|uniref:hypothetical protein n=1 Tax=Fervidobacterium changbaicum TaxID=310769 RepID=UPI001C409526|nr:hypothetical protein [Fervidobacterium changbaicum]